MTESILANDLPSFHWLEKHSCLVNYAAIETDQYYLALDLLNSGMLYFVQGLVHVQLGRYSI